MSVKFTNTVSMTVSSDDVTRILTEAICTFGNLAGLEVWSVSQNDEGDFDLTLEPKPAKKEAE